MNLIEQIKELGGIKMVRILGIAFMCIITSGCVTTTKVIIKHQFPDEHIQYEISKEWIREY